MLFETESIRFTNCLEVLKAGKEAIRGGDCLMDLQNVKSTDSSAVAVVLEWIRAAQAENKALRVLNEPRSFVKLKKLYGVADLIR